MRIHILSIIPLSVGVILLALALNFQIAWLISVSGVFLIYGTLVHIKNVAITRKQDREWDQEQDPLEYHYHYDVSPTRRVKIDSLR